ncbi:uncharacterized protein BDZ99DRAFT_73509 [Mytilinidion resinicola]|uniref:Rhodopsin domain-containing protein n=1 Tax=Mytilinidion resinicola TaxID=574789 RepID=A0A6A6YH17_9PEZI|nr:uncharacterized protein BDZ99DRAFT_73509 [Mytilinidion resinicola]KAF2808112.1 hypothetical protein BDZ99DRAFT_73509 [Mytilinidion resinicola]
MNPLMGALGAFSDFYTVVLSAGLIWHLEMQRREKIGLCVILTMALLVTGAGIARSIQLSQLADSPLADVTWHGFDVFVSSQLECQFAIICACAPSLKVFAPRQLATPFSRPNQESRTLANSVVSSRSGSILPERFKRSMQLKRVNSQRPLVISDPQVLEIPDWATEAFESPRYTNTAMDVEVYERYVAGKYGPPPPPKDHGEIFAQYRAAAIPSKDLFAQYRDEFV